MCNKCSNNAFVYTACLSVQLLGASQHDTCICQYLQSFQEVADPSERTEAAILKNTELPRPVHTSEHPQPRRHLPMLLQSLDGLPQHGRVGRREWDGWGAVGHVVQDELCEGVQQEDGGTSSHQCCSAEGVARVCLQPFCTAEGDCKRV